MPPFETAWKAAASRLSLGALSISPTRLDLAYVPIGVHDLGTRVITSLKNLRRVQAAAGGYRFRSLLRAGGMADDYSPSMAETPKFS